MHGLPAHAGRDRRLADAVEQGEARGAGGTRSAEAASRLAFTPAVAGRIEPDELPPQRGAGDISFVAADVDSLVGLGPASSGDHTAGETVDLASLWRQAKRAALLMSRLAAERAR